MGRWSEFVLSCVAYSPSAGHVQSAATCARARRGWPPGRKRPLALRVMRFAPPASAGVTHGRRGHVPDDDFHSGVEALLLNLAATPATPSPAPAKHWSIPASPMAVAAMNAVTDGPLPASTPSPVGAPGACGKRWMRLEPEPVVIVPCALPRGHEGLCAMDPGASTEPGAGDGDKRVSTSRVRGCPALAGEGCRSRYSGISLDEGRTHAHTRPPVSGSGAIDIAQGDAMIEPVWRVGKKLGRTLYREAAASAWSTRRLLPNRRGHERRRT